MWTFASSQATNAPLCQTRSVFSTPKLLLLSSEEPPGDRFVAFRAAHLDQAELAIGLDVVGAELHGLAEHFLRFRLISASLADLRQVVERGGRLGRERDGLLDLLECRLGVAVALVLLLQEQHPAAQRVELALVRVELERPLQSVERGREVAPPHRLLGPLELLLGGEDPA